VPSYSNSPYRGRLAPSPTGLLHLGHARTFWTAAHRAAEHHGQLILRNEDLDPHRCKPEFVRAMYEDLRWLGIDWTEGPDRGGPFAPYSQSERRPHYLATWQTLRTRGLIYPCTCSRKDVAQSASALQENDSDDDPIYPGHCRPKAVPSSTGDHLNSCGDGRLVRPAEAKPRGTHPIRFCISPRCPGCGFSRGASVSILQRSQEIESTPIIRCKISLSTRTCS
jgi:glutamyl/glutaminyl-tRNA synthetase